MSIVTAALSWYDEPVKDLERAVRSLAGIADRIVALDGAYARFPNGRSSSPREQAEAIRRVSEEIGIACLILSVDRLWAGQIEKRNYLVRVASRDADWVLVMDADQVIVGDTAAARERIDSRSDVDVWTVDLIGVQNKGRPVEESASTTWHEAHLGDTTPFAHLFRVYPDLRYERFHWWVSALRGDSRFWLQYGGNGYAASGQVVAEHVRLPDYRIEHRSMFHPADRVKAYRAFCNDRAKVVYYTHQEDNIRGLPDPEWDYETRTQGYEPKGLPIGQWASFWKRLGKPVVVTAALCWYDEDIPTLERCVRALAGIADRLVALDGAYARFPGAKVASPPEQAAAISRVAAEVGIECMVLTPSRLWRGQVEKRTFLMSTAAINSDWIAVVDADHVMVTPDGLAVRDTLAETPQDVLVYDVDFYTPENPEAEIAQIASWFWHSGMAKRTLPIAHFFRALPGMRVERFHWWVSGIHEGRRVWLWGGDSTNQQAKRMDFPVPYRVDHFCLHRDEQHVLANRAYLNDREVVKLITGQEDDVLGLPPPQWDYETMRA